MKTKLAKTNMVCLAMIVLMTILGLNDASGQWNFNGNHIYNTNSQFIGIGTGTSWTPTEKLHINNGADISGIMSESSYSGTSMRAIGYLRVKNAVSGDILNISLRKNGATHEMLQSCYDASTSTWREYAYFNYSTGKYEMRAGINLAEFKNSGNILFNNTGKVGIGVTDPGAYKLFVQTTAAGGAERAVAHFRNNDNSIGSLCDVYVSSGDGGSTYLNYCAPSYIHQGGKYMSHSILGNNGKGLVFRTGWDDEGRIAFEFKRDVGDEYVYDEKVSITYDGYVGIGTTIPNSKLFVKGYETTADGRDAAITVKNNASGGGEWILRSGATGTNTPSGGFSISNTVGYAMSIASSGNVGINTLTPTSKLEVAGRNIEIGDYVFLGIMYSGVDLLLGSNMKSIDYENTRGAVVANDWPGGYSGIKMYHGDIQFHTKGGQVYAGDPASNEQMRITPEGNVGIGIATPQRRLHINDVMRLQPRTTAPSSPSEGDIYMDGNSHVLKVYNGTEWKSCW